MGASINGWPLPEALVRAMAEGRWRCPPPAVLRRVFREAPVRAVLHEVDAMRRVNERWLVEANPAFFGHADPRSPPGDIDRSSSVLLGELGPDLPFALDYRSSTEHPRVLYLHSGGNVWITVARHIDDLLARLRLAAVRRGDTSHRRRPGSPT